MSRNKGADSEATWTALLSAANDLLRRDGISQLSLRGVARAAGHQLGTLQYYFPRKESLIEAVLGESYKRVRQFVKEALSTEESDLSSRYSRLTAGFYQAARQYRHLSRARITTNLVAGRMSRSSRESLERAATALANQYSLDPDDLRVAIHMMSALSLRLASHSAEELKWLTGADTDEDAQARIEHMLSVFAKAAAADHTNSQD